MRTTIRFGFDREQRLRSEAHRFQRSRPEAFDEHGRTRHEPKQKVAPFLVSQLEREAFLVACVELPICLNAFHFPGAQRVSCSRLDLDDFSAEIT